MLNSLLIQEIEYSAFSESLLKFIQNPVPDRPEYFSNNKLTHLQFYCKWYLCVYMFQYN